MQTIIYRTDGTLICQISGDAEIGGYITCEDPAEGYYIQSVNPETKEPVFAPVPKTAEQQRLDELAAQIAALKKSSEAKDDALSEQQDFQEDCIAEMASVVYADDGETE